MSQTKLKDKSWGIVFILFFVAPPIGFIALVVKIIYMIYKSQDTSQGTYDTSYKGNSAHKSATTYGTKPNNYSDELHDLEEDLVDVFHQWKDKSEDVQSSSKEDRIVEKTYEIIREEAPVDEPMMKVEPYDYLSTEHLESDLNISTDALRVDDVVEVNTDIDLTFTDVHIDTEITFDDELEDHDHEGEVPLKVVKCRMCDTENRIYKIDKFETPTCENCGMLLLDR